MVNHHQTAIWGNIVYFFQASNKQIQEKAKTLQAIAREIRFVHFFFRKSHWFTKFFQIFTLIFSFLGKSSFDILQVVGNFKVFSEMFTLKFWGFH